MAIIHRGIMITDSINNRTILAKEIVGHCNPNEDRREKFMLAYTMYRKGLVSREDVNAAMQYKGKTTIEVMVRHYTQQLDRERISFNAECKRVFDNEVRKRETMIGRVKNLNVDEYTNTELVEIFNQSTVAHTIDLVKPKVARNMTAYRLYAI